MMTHDSLRTLLWTRYEIPPSGHPLHAPLQHVLAAHGSLARPRLPLVSARRHNWIDGHALDLAAAMELFHTASLVLDDLPCMDNAADRRGVACVHHVHGEAADAELGANGILLGQALDLAARDGRQTDIADLADLKTGSLLRLSLMIQVAAAGNLAEISLVNQLSRVWGEAYQLLDDIQDTGCDAAAGSPNRVTDEGLSRALARYGNLVAHIDHRLRHRLRAAGVPVCARHLASRRPGAARRPGPPGLRIRGLHPLPQPIRAPHPGRYRTLGRDPVEDHRADRQPTPRAGPHHCRGSPPGRLEPGPPHRPAALQPRKHDAFLRPSLRAAGHARRRPRRLPADLEAHSRTSCVNGGVQFANGRWCHTLG